MIPPPPDIVVFDGTLDEFHAECGRLGVDAEALLAREFHGRVYIAHGAPIRGWPRCRPLAPGPYDDQFAPAPMEDGR